MCTVKTWIRWNISLINRLESSHFKSFERESMNGMYLKLLTLSDSDAASDRLSLAPTMKEVEWIHITE